MLSMNKFCHPQLSDNTAVIQLTRNELTKEIFGLTKVFWNNFAIKLFPCDHQQKGKKNNKLNLDWFYPLLQSATSLHLTCDHFDLVKMEKCQPNFPSIISKILCASENLQKFGIGTNILLSLFDNEDLLNQILSSKETVKVLGNLHEFNVSLDAIDIPDITASDYRTKDESMMNKLVESMKNLRIITVQDVNDQCRSLMIDYTDSKNVEKNLSQFIYKLIELNHHHLHKLQCEYFVLQLVLLNKTQDKIKFPFLKHFLVYNLNCNDDGKETFDENFIHFVQHLSLLDEIDFRWGSGPFSSQLWNVIREKSVNLKRLSIKMRQFDKKEKGRFHFLRGLHHLQDFQLDLSTAYYGGEKQNIGPLGYILLCLPGKSIRKCSINGLRSTNPNYFISNRHFASFLNPCQLRVLRLSRYESSITDETLEFIFRTFTKLEIFEMSEIDGSSTCTDYGFTGIIPNSLLSDYSDAKPDFSIKDLTELKSLTIRNCEEITNSVCKSLVFAQLRRLDISRNENISAEGINFILKNNLCLEYLKISLSHYEQTKLTTKRPPRFRILDFPVRSDRNSDISFDEADAEDPDGGTVAYPGAESKRGLGSRFYQKF